MSSAADTSTIGPEHAFWKASAALGLGAVTGVAVLFVGKLAVTGLVGLLVFCVFVRYPVCGVYLTTAALLLSGQAGVLARGSLPVTVAKLLGVATLGAWLLHVVVYRKRLTMGWPILIILVFLAWMGLCTITGPEPRRQLRVLLRLATVVSFFVVCCETLDTKEKARSYLLILCVCGFAMSALGVAQYVVPRFHMTTEAAAVSAGVFVDPEGTETQAAVRVGGSLGHSNWLALALLLLLPLNLPWLSKGASLRTKLLVLGVTATELCALILTFTRMGLLVGASILVLLVCRGAIRVSAQRIVALLVLGAVVLVAVPTAYKERVLRFGRYMESDSARARAELQKTAWALWQKSPVKGMGLGAFGLRLQSEASSDIKDLVYLWETYMGGDPIAMGAHNMYLQTLVEGGAVGLGLLVTFCLSLLVGQNRCYVRSKKANDAWGMTLYASIQVSLIGFLFCAVFLHALLEKIEWMIFALAYVSPRFCAFQESDTAEAMPEGIKEGFRDA